MNKYIKFFSFMLLLTCFLIVGKPASAKTISYHFDNIPDRTITYTGEDNFLYVTINNVTYVIESETEIALARCSTDGTIWISASGSINIFWINYEIQKEYMNMVGYANGAITLNNDDDFTHSYSSHLIKLDYPSIEYLQLVYSTHDKPENPTPTIDPSEIPTGTPVPTEEPVKPTSPVLTETPVPTEPSSTEKPAPIATIPAPTQLPVPTETIPTPTSAPIPTASAPADSNTTPEPVGKPASVIKKGSTISLVDSNGNILKTITLKAGKLTVNGKSAVKNVKSAYFTKKGTVVYLTKSGKAYYINSKNKSKLIKAKVKKVKTSKGFATTLKLKNGKTVKIRV